MLTTFLRNFIKEKIFDILNRAFLHHDGISILHDSLGSHLRNLPAVSSMLDNQNPPYHNLNTLHKFNVTRLQQIPIFITGRFRSGSTLLWNILRNTDKCTAYYEPLNERQWFDPDVRGFKIDSTHVNVSNDYWREYEGLKEKLSSYYHKNWINRNLYMDKSSSDWHLQKYIEKLIENASSRPVLQFNRVDFRLPWLRNTFPNAKFVHIYRHPRDQWVSTLMNDNLQSSSINTLYDFGNFDKFYLRHWIEDLQFWFPFLRDWTLHPYCHFYYLWRLSFLFGQQYCDDSIKFEELTSDPANTLDKLFNNLNINVDNIDNLLPLIQTPKPNKWELFATDQWFKAQELFCETELHNFFGWSS